MADVITNSAEHNKFGICYDNYKWSYDAIFTSSLMWKIPMLLTFWKLNKSCIEEQCSTNCSYPKIIQKLLRY